MSNVYTTLVDDAFAQSDGPLESVNWTLTTAAGGGYTHGNVVAHLLEPPTVGNAGAEIYTGASGWLAGGQFLEITLATLEGDPGNFAGFGLLTDLMLDNGIGIYLSPDGAGNVIIQLYDVVADVQIGTDFSTAFVPGAKYRIECFESTITHFYDGAQIAQFTGLTQFAAASGLPAFFIEIADVPSNLQISRFTAGNISLAPTPPSGSIREQIFVAAQAVLGGAGAPAGLTVTRERLRPIEKESLPAVLLYADDDTPKPLAGVAYKAPLTERQLSLVVECRANAGTNPPDVALDPLLVWVTQALIANEKFGGLANGIEEQRTTWISREGEIAVAAAAIHFTVKYRTARADPTKKDPNS